MSKAEFANLFYPPLCAVCGCVGERLCRVCAPLFKKIDGPCCSVCGIPLAAGFDLLTCSNCRDELPFFFSQRSLFVFDGAVRHLITQIKYHAQFWGVPFLFSLTDFYLPDFIDVLMPVPLHKTRLKKRGYNQGAEMTRVLSRKLNLPADFHALVRVKDTASQTGLTRAARKGNLRDAFDVVKPAGVSGKKILLLDDVFTTGATLNAVSEALMNAGAGSVHGLTLALTLKEF